MKNKNLILGLLFLLWAGTVIAQENNRFTDASRLTYVKKKTGANGQGSMVGIQDSRVKYHKIQYRGRLTYDQNIIFDDPSGSHGTHVTLKAFGNGNLTPVKNQAADGTEVFSQFKEATLYNTLQAHPNLYVTNRSLGGDIAGSYGPKTRFLDKAILDHENFIYVFSSGNEKGSTEARTSYGLYTSNNSNFNGIGADNMWARISGSRKHGKNGITVGALRTMDKPSTISSPGPAYDGRIKPEIVANGGKPNAATSFVAPVIAASITVLQQLYKDAHPQKLAAPSAYLKALLLNTADDIGRPGPDFTTGFGRVNSRRAYEAMKKDQMASYNLTMNDEVSVDFDGSGSNIISIPTPTQGSKWARLKIMLYWHDVDDESSPNKALVNDIDLSASHFKFNGTLIKNYLPLVPDPRYLSGANGNKLLDLAQERVDHLNNVEQIVIENPIPGSYVKVDLSAYAIPNGSQLCYVVYDLVPEELVLTYPVAGETDVFVQGESEYIRWDANGFKGDATSSSDNDQFQIEMWIDGTWKLINTIRNQDYEGNPTNYAHNEDRHYLLDLDAIEAQFGTFDNFAITRIRIMALDKNGTPIPDAISESGDITICKTVKQLSMTSLCEDGGMSSAAFTWNPIAGANDYRVYRLGLSNQEMQPVQYTNGQTGVLLKHIERNGLPEDGKTEWREWVAIAPIFRDAGGNEIEGRRCQAIEITGSDFGCEAAVIPVGGLHTRVMNTDLHAHVLPVSGKPITNIQFQYNLGGAWINVGPLNTQVYTTAETISQFLNFPAPDRINTGDKYHFRLEYEVSGVPKTTAALSIQLPAGTALNLTGSESIKMPYISEYNGNAERTIDFWAKVDGLNGGSLIAIGEESEASGSNDILELKTTDNSNELEWRFNDGMDHVFAVPNLLNDWHHYAIIYQNGNLQLLMDGEIVYQNNSIQLNTGEYDIKIGSAGFKGQIDEIRFWSVAKNLAELRTIIHAPSLAKEYKGSTVSGATNELLRYLQFNEEGEKPLENVSMRSIKTSAPISYVPAPLPMGGPKFGTALNLTGGVNHFLNQSSLMTVGNNWINSDIVVTRIDANPHHSAVSSVELPGGVVKTVAQVYDKSYNVFYNHSNTNEVYDLKMGLLDLSTSEDPKQIALLRRSSNGSEHWTFVKVADTLSQNSYNTFAHFDGIDAFGQFMVVKFDSPVNRRVQAEERSAGLALKLYPNPLRASLELNIEIEGEATELQLSIFDQLGNIVKSELLTDRANSISVAHLAAGIYTCQILGERSRVLYQIVILE